MRMRSTSRSASIRPRSQAWTICSSCAPPRALPPICSRASTVHARLRRPRLLAPPSPHTACPPFESRQSRQSASAFNQPL
eukprot:scaffold103244_cov86-Phaeocystis_antarctica.AAC.1